jgi:hypothetical protein
VFLRAEHFDPVKAAGKMARYFNNKLELWGDAKLVNRLTLDDLGEKEMEHLYAGSTQFTPVNEGGLQAAYFLLSANKDISDWKAITRYMWYQILSFILENEEAQKRGNVGLVGMALGIFL